MGFSFRASSLPNTPGNGKSATGSATCEKRTTKKAEGHKSANRLLDQYEEFMIEGWPNQAASNDISVLLDDEDFIQVEIHSPDADVEYPEDESLLDGAKKERFASVSDDVVENSRGLQTKYHLEPVHGTNARGVRRAGGVVGTLGGVVGSEKEFKEYFEAIKSQANNLDILFDAEDALEEGVRPAPVVVPNSADVMEQFARLHMYEDNVERKPEVTECHTSKTSKSFLGLRSPNQLPLLFGFGELTSFDGMSASNASSPLATPTTSAGLSTEGDPQKPLVDDFRTRETTLVDDEPSRSFCGLIPDVEFLDAREVQLWDPMIREYMVDVYNDLSHMSMGQNLPPKSVPKPSLSVHTGRQDAVIGKSDLLSRRYEKWATKQNDEQREIEDNHHKFDLDDDALYRCDDEEFLTDVDVAGEDLDTNIREELEICSLFTFYDDTEEDECEEEKEDVLHSNNSKGPGQAFESTYLYAPLPSRPVSKVDSDEVCEPLVFSDVPSSADRLLCLEIDDSYLRCENEVHKEHHVLSVSATNVTKIFADAMPDTASVRSMRIVDAQIDSTESVKGGVSDSVTFFDTNAQRQITYTALTQLICSDSEREGTSYEQDKECLVSEKPQLELIDWWPANNDLHRSQPTGEYLEASLYQPQQTLRVVNGNSIRKLVGASSSESSIDFKNHRGFVQPLQTCRTSFLKDEDEHDTRIEPTRETSTISPLFAGGEIERTYFSDRIWSDIDLIFLETIAGTFQSGMRTQELLQELGANISPDIMAMKWDEERVPQINIQPASPVADSHGRFHVTELDQNLLQPISDTSYELRFRLQQKLAYLCQLRQDIIRREIELLEKDVLTFVEWAMTTESLQGLDQMLADANWAVNHLHQANHNSALVQQLKATVWHCQERINTTKLGSSENTDPIWSTAFTPNDVANDQYDWVQTVPRVALDQLIETCPSFPLGDDLYVPFSIQDAQEKYMLWMSERELVNPSDPNYEMLTSAHKVSENFLEHLKDNTCTIKQLADNYADNVRKGNWKYLEEMNKMILKHYNAETPSGLGGKSLGKFCQEVQTLYHASRPKSQFIHSSPQSLQKLEEWNTVLKKWKLDLQLTSTPSAQADDTYHMMNRFWKTAYTCMETIQTAHNDVCLTFADKEMIPSFVEMEDLMWCLWLGVLRESMDALAVFASKIHPSFLPTINDMLINSIEWWEAKNVHLNMGD